MPTTDAPSETCALRRFCDAVIASPALQDRLGQYLAADDFTRACADNPVARALGIDAAAFDAALHGQRSLPALFLDDAAPTPWMPTHATPPQAVPQGLAWSWFGARDLTAPFFEETGRSVRSLPLNRLLRIETDITCLATMAHQSDSVPVAGLIFHMSRCGSTYLARLLQAGPANLVLSEPDPLDAVLRWSEHAGADWPAAVAAVRGVVAAMARRRSLPKDRLFIKLDAWHTHYLPLLREAFPHTPWLYLFRDPVEVLMSHLAMPGRHVVPGSEPGILLGIDTRLAYRREEHIARVLAAIGASALTHWHVGGGLAVDYAGLASGGLEVLESHFRLPAGSLIDIDARIGAFDAKHPDGKFVTDAARKRRESTAFVRDVAARFLSRLHDRLGALARVGAATSSGRHGERARINQNRPI